MPFPLCDRGHKDTVYLICIHFLREPATETAEF